MSSPFIWSVCLISHKQTLTRIVWSVRKAFGRSSCCLFCTSKDMLVRAPTVHHPTVATELEWIANRMYFCVTVLLGAQDSFQKGHLDEDVACEWTVTFFLLRKNWSRLILRWKGLLLRNVMHCFSCWKRKYWVVMFTLSPPVLFT